MSRGLAAAAAVAAGLAAIIGIWLGALWLQKDTADFRGGVDATERIQADGDFRIAAYQRFYDLCSAVQALEDRIAIYTNASGPEAETNLNAVRSRRASLIREYNALASRDWTEGQFRSNNLPYQLNPDQENTTCAA